MPCSPSVEEGALHPFRPCATSGGDTGLDSLAHQGWAGLRWAGLAGLGLWQGEACPGPPASGVLTSLLTTLKLFLTSSSLLLPVLPGTHLLPPSWSGPGPPSPIPGVPLGSLPSILLLPRMTLFSHSSGTLPSRPSDGSCSGLQAGSLALSSPLTHPSSRLRAAAAPSGLVPPLSHHFPNASATPLPFPERPPPSSSVMSWALLFSFTLSSVFHYINHCNFCSVPLSSPWSSPDFLPTPTQVFCLCVSPPSPEPAWLEQQPWVEPHHHHSSTISNFLKPPSASCLTSLKPPFIPFPPVRTFLGDNSHDALVPGLWVQFPQCHFLAVCSSQVAIPL